MPSYYRRAAAGLGVLGTCLALAIPSASAQLPIIGPIGTTSVVEAPDYASENNADPWDFANQDDFYPGTPVGVRDARLTNGQLSLTTANTQPVIDQVPYLPGSLAVGRDGRLRPVLGTRYTRFAVRLYSSARTTGSLVWTTCSWYTRACQGAHYFTVYPGWQTYDFAPQAMGSLTKPWANRLVGIHFYPASAAGLGVKIDWMRVYQPARAATDVPYDSPQGAHTRVYWDADADQANNVSSNPAWGLLHTDSTGGQGAARFPTSAFPPGTYRFYTVTDGGTSTYSNPLQILAAPRPVIDSPSIAGGADYATTVRRNPWDFSSSSDTTGIYNAGNVCFCNGVLRATNAAPRYNNPYVQLPLSGWIDGNRWHRVTIKTRYDGPFGLEDAPGAGMVGRLVWDTAGAWRVWQNLHDIVLYPGWRTITFSLKTNPAYQIVDETQDLRRIGWAGQKITSLRFDPNEDPGRRTWYIDEIRLAEDAVGRGGFDIAFHDAAWQPGVTADIYVDDNSNGWSGRKIAAGVQVAQGRNVFRWSAPRDMTARAYWFFIVLTGPNGVGRSYSSGPLQLKW